MSLEHLTRQAFKWKYWKADFFSAKINFDFICRGFGSKEIAIAINISLHRIDTHRANIAEKLETSSVADFVRLQLLSKSPQYQ